MTWASKLIEKLIFKSPPEGLYESGYVDGLRDSKRDLVLAVLEEYNKIVDESKRDFAEDDVEHEIEIRLTSMAMELVKEAQRVNLK